MNKKFLISILLIIIVIIVGSMLHKTQNKKITQNQVDKNTVNEAETSKTVEEIKKETGATADEEIYEVQQEYDGREILTIKPDIQYKTVLAGILKNGQPSLHDIEQLNLSDFHKGIWISEISRDKFLQILKKCGIENYEIDSKGYLFQKENSSNEYSKKLENLINSNELTIIDIRGICYIRDEMTGDIVEYPFKDMDLYQICEKFNTDGSSIIIITTNKVDEIDILKSICQ